MDVPPHKQVVTWEDDLPPAPLPAPQMAPQAFPSVATNAAHDKSGKTFTVCTSLDDLMDARIDRVVVSGQQESVPAHGLDWQGWIISCVQGHDA